MKGVAIVTPFICVPSLSAEIEIPYLAYQDVLGTLGIYVHLEAMPADRDELGSVFDHQTFARRVASC